ncbi:ROK domain protein [Amycolatopsis azurea DSM 43854]|nr:ROK domain protein [Amycolatopsis azurea DSM 43854]
MDIGGTKVSFRLVLGAGGAEGEVLWSSLARWPESSADVADDLTVLRTRVKELRDASQHRFAGVGVAVAATVDPSGRVVSWPNRGSWGGLDLLGELRSLFPESEIVWADDGALAAVAEARAADVPCLVYAGVGTGIGGGVVVGGRLLSALSRGACELGHMIVNHGGSPCTCGRRGCVQSEASGPATLRRASAARGVNVSFDQLRAGYLGGETWAVAAVEHSCMALAAALAGIGELAAPAVHVVGGGFAAGIPGFVDEVGRQAAALSRPGHPVAPVVPARFGGESSLRGAVSAAMGALSE